MNIQLFHFLTECFFPTFVSQQNVFNSHLVPFSYVGPVGFPPHDKECIIKTQFTLEVLLHVYQCKTFGSLVTLECL